MSIDDQLRTAYIAVVLFLALIGYAMTENTYGEDLMGVVQEAQQ